MRQVYYRLRGEYKAWRERQLYLIGEFLLRFSGFKARKPLVALNHPQMLIDTSVFFHAVTHETAWISTGKKKWGGIHEFDSGYQARIPVHDPRHGGRIYTEVTYLLGITELFRQGYLKLQTSAEIRAEMHRQPHGRFSGYGMQDLSILNWNECPTIDGHLFDFMGDAKQKQLDRIARCDDLAYTQFAKLLPQKMSLDAYHIYTASKHKIPFFLHVDFPLAEAIKQVGKKTEFKRLGVEVMLPSQFGKRFGLIPVPPVVISQRNRKFSVRPDLHWPDNKRQRPKPKGKEFWGHQT